MKKDIFSPDAKLTSRQINDLYKSKNVDLINNDFCQLIADVNNNAPTYRRAANGKKWIYVGLCQVGCNSMELDTLIV